MMALSLRWRVQDLLYNKIWTSVPCHHHCRPDVRYLHGGRPQPSLAFAFDIDGVLLRGEKAIPGAREALSVLEGYNTMGLKIPYILLTNGGGVSEEARCEKLTTQLGVQIRPEQYIQAHTVLKSRLDKYSDSNILVLGGKHDAVRKVAEGYGFKHVYNTLDVLAWNPSIWRFHDLTTEELSSVKKVDFSNIAIDAAFVFHDPRDWALDIQILCDLARSGGKFVGSKLGGDSHGPLELVFCNPDLLWRSDYDVPRLGQGAFRDAFQTVYKALTETTYPYVQLGKPTEATYKFAETVLRDRIEDMGGSRELPTVYMVGDNPESDIAGANAAKWQSILVHTGVYNPEQGPPRHRPTHEATDVATAVKWALERELQQKIFPH